MNILLIVDTPDWAINSLTQSIIKYNSRHRFFTVFAHPRNVAPAIQEVQNILREHKIDLVHGMYWRSATQVIEYCAELKKVPLVLSHHNTAHLRKADWRACAKALVAPTQAVANVLKDLHDDVRYIPYGIELEEYPYIEQPSHDGRTVGYVGRVVEHKNLRLVCDTAKALNYRVVGSGYIEDAEYYQGIASSDVLQYHGGVGRQNMNGWKSKNNLYEQMTVYAMVSTSYETGPLPMLEAMARGVPVICTMQGMACDIIKDGENGILCTPENFEMKLKQLMEDPSLREKIRQGGRRTIQRYAAERMAMQYGMMYDSIAFPSSGEPLVSVIIPTYNRKDTIESVIDSVEQQSYKHVEVIVVDDGSDDGTEILLQESLAFHKWSIPVQYIRSDHNGYGLARSRNHGVVESRGSILVFLDDRLKLAPDAVLEFVKSSQAGQWLYGQKHVDDKPSKNNGFVENFSSIRRHDLLKMGLFNEQLNVYGGMSQDIRIRCMMNGINTTFIPNAGAHQIRKAQKMKRPNEQWQAKLLLYKLYGE